MDWKSKLTSRKFWTAVAGFVSMLLVALGQPQETGTKITALIMASATVIAYIFGEGMVDAHNASLPNPGDETPAPPEEKNG